MEEDVFQHSVFSVMLEMLFKTSLPGLKVHMHAVKTKKSILFDMHVVNNIANSATNVVSVQPKKNST